MLLNEQQKERLTELMTSTPVRRTRHVGRTALIAAAVCALCTVAALAASPTLRDTLNMALGGFEPYSQTLEETAVTDQGIRVSVVKSLADESGGVIYLEIKDTVGDRLTEDTQFPGAYPLITPMAYDPETHTLLARTGWTAGYDIRDEDGVATLSIGRIWGGEGLWDGSIVLPVELLEPGNVRKTMVLPEEERNGAEDDGVVLVPEQTPMALEGTDLFTLSSAGFDDRGLLHVQVKAAEGVDISRVYVELASVHAIVEDKLDISNRNFSLTGHTRELEDGLYVDFCVLPILFGDSQPGALNGSYLPKEIYQGQRITLSGWVGTREQVYGDWTLSFPVETLPNRTLAVNQVVNTKLIENVTLSARSATLRLVHTNDIYGDLSMLPLTVYLSDGTYITMERGHGTHWYEDEEPYYLDTWEFPEPIDPAEVVGLSLSYWYVPLEGDSAQPGHWMARLPD